MVIDELRRSTNLTESEKIISEFIVNHPDKFQQMNSEELAKETFTSKSTVIRLCKKLNVSGYQELKKILYSELNEERKFGKEGTKFSWELKAKRTGFEHVRLEQKYVDQYGAESIEDELKHVLNSDIEEELYGDIADELLEV